MSKNNPAPEVQWSGPQVFIVAAVALLFGMLLGYFVRGTMAEDAAPVQAAPAQPAGMPGNAGMPAVAMEAHAAPLLERLKKNPNDYEALVKLGNMYTDIRMFPQAIDFYTRALQIEPNNVSVRTDLGTAYFSSGEPQAALREYEKSLQIEPAHAQTLFNIGVLKWQALNDRDGALKSWETLLKLNPEFPQRERVEAMIKHARSGGKVKP
jgi:cytochrome c-type biogenesis protein CcmH/NrfG